MFLTGIINTILPSKLLILPGFFSSLRLLLLFSEYKSPPRVGFVFHRRNSPEHTKFSPFLHLENSNVSVVINSVAFGEGLLDDRLVRSW